MIALAQLIEQFETPFMQRYGSRLLPSQQKAFVQMKRCRTHFAPLMLAQCTACDQQRAVPQSCGHRSCPHCQHHESQVWLERQLKAQVPAPYFLITFTLPAQLRALAWDHQRQAYALLMQCAWDTLNTFSLNDAKLGATPGAVGVLHTHSRRLDFHPHVHMVMPAAALDTERKLWRTKVRGTRRPRAKDRAGKASAAASKTTSATGGTPGGDAGRGTPGTTAGGTPGGGYLFNHTALAKVFRGKLIAALKQAGLPLPADLPQTWVVDCKCVGDGQKALIYLGRYLYRGVIQERDIVRSENGQVTFQYRDAKTDKMAQRTLDGADFLWLVLQHVLPKGLRRARNFGFLHHNSAGAIRLLQVLHLRAAPTVALAPANTLRPAWRCTCGQPMIVLRRHMPPVRHAGQPNAQTERPDQDERAPHPPDKPDAQQAHTMH